MASVRVLGGAALLGLVAGALRSPALQVPFLDLGGWVLFLAGAVLGAGPGALLGALVGWAGSGVVEALPLAIVGVAGGLWQDRLCMAASRVPRPVLAGLLGIGAGFLAAAPGWVGSGVPPADEITTRGIFAFLLYGTTIWWMVTPVDGLRELLEGR
jgi:hypothetical protein